MAGSGGKSQGRKDESRSIYSPLGRGVAVLITAASVNLVGVVQGLMPNGLVIRVKQELAEGSRVAVEFGAVVLEGETASCRAREDGYEARIIVPSMHGSELRAAQRFPIDQGVLISAASCGSAVDGEVVDLSASGIGLEIATPLEPGEIVTIESQSSFAFGNVRYCQRLPRGGFHVGLEVFHIMPK